MSLMAETLSDQSTSRENKKKTSFFFKVKPQYSIEYYGFNDQLTVYIPVQTRETYKSL